MVERMSILAVRLGFILVAAALCLHARAAHAQSAPVQYWTPGWLGFGGPLNFGEGSNTDSRFAGLDGSETGGFAVTRTNFPNGLFVGGQRGSMGLSGISGASAFGSLQSEGVQFGYNFKNAPVTFYAGFDSLKYNTGLGSALSPFDSTAGTVPGFAVNAGVEFRPASNLSLSLGVGYVQQSGRLDTESRLPSLSNASQFDLVGGRR